MLMVFLSACSNRPGVVHIVDSYTGKGPHTVFIVSHGRHTGFVINADEMLKRIPDLQSRFPDADYIEAGWGDEGFYRAKAITARLTLKALFWPTDSVIHAVAVPGNVEQYFYHSEIESLCLNDQQLSSLIRFIEHSFYRNKKGHILARDAGLYGDSQFYKGAGKYHLMNTCNTWTARGLQSAGVDINPLFKLTAGSIMTHIQEVNQSLGKISLGGAATCSSK